MLTEGGFGADMGLEKFVNIKCRVSGLKPDATVIVATTRALKMHGGGPDVTPGKPLHDTYLKEDLVTLKEGSKNLRRHIENSRKFGLKVIVAINQFSCVFPCLSKFTLACAKSPLVIIDLTHPPNSSSSRVKPLPPARMQPSSATTGPKAAREPRPSPKRPSQSARVNLSSSSSTTSRRASRPR